MFDKCFEDIDNNLIMLKGDRILLINEYTTVVIKVEELKCLCLDSELFEIEVHDDLGLIYISGK
ncbi:hypothetical protein [uncultured Clostridium sp.]|uniref:hypothetical protein n=1 Tax=uncultured Clostridium sp. TaxID=59620 RepID=UPI00260C5B81|nr:hypothetical protein [uncultured Clostridium sp.]